MRVERVISVGRDDQPRKSVEETRRLSHEERLSLLEDLRREMALVTGNEYPQRLRRVLEVVEQGEG
jgi:nicotinamide riboside kinase